MRDASIARRALNPRLQDSDDDQRCPVWFCGL